MIILAELDQLRSLIGIIDAQIREYRDALVGGGSARVPTSPWTKPEADELWRVSELSRLQDRLVKCQAFLWQAEQAVAVNRLADAILEVAKSLRREG